MDQENYLIRSYLSFGHFDSPNDEQMSKRTRSFVDCLIKLTVLLNASKLCIMLWRSDLKLFLVELFLFDQHYQKLLDVGVAFIQIGYLCSFVYWSSLNKQPELRRCFDFLFISDLKELSKTYGKRYNLERKATETFLSKYRLFCSFLGPGIAGYAAFVFIGVLRCLYNSYPVVSPAYFYCVCLPLSAVTTITYLLMDWFIITKYILVFLSAEFSMLRVKAIEQMIRKRFARRLPSANGSMKFGKERPATFKILYALNDFARQFKQMNQILDSSLSKIILGDFIAFYALPYFIVFAENPLVIRLSICAMIFASYLLFCAISFYNDRLRKQVRIFKIFLIRNHDHFDLYREIVN